MSETTEHVAQEQHQEHPGPRQYVMVAVVLAVITAIEVAIFYIPALAESAIFVPLLLVLSTLKFALVVLWFMHLRFDSRLYRRLFVAGLVLAVSLFLIVLFIFGVFGGQPRVQMS